MLHISVSAAHRLVAHAVGVLGYRPGMFRDRRVVGLAPERRRAPEMPAVLARLRSAARSGGPLHRVRYGLRATVPEPAAGGPRAHAGRRPRRAAPPLDRVRHF